MKKKNLWTLIIIVVIVIIAIGSYVIFHNKSPKVITTTTSSTSQSNAPSVNNAVVITKTSSSLGKYLADPSGRTLYTYGGDSSGVSNCTGSCLTTWPAYQDTGATTGLPAGISTIKRTDNGQTQYTYNGLPLYYFVSDSQGQVTGNGVGNFQVAKPAAASPSTTSSSSSSSSDSSPGYSY